MNKELNNRHRVEEHDGPREGWADKRSSFSTVTLRELLGSNGEKEGASLDDLLEKVISAGEKFVKWKESGEALRMTRFFHKIDGQMFPIERFSQLSCLGFFGIVLNVEMQNDSQFEIWECNEECEP
jgi:hypothetical protein